VQNNNFLTLAYSRYVKLTFNNLFIFAGMPRIIAFDYGTKRIGIAVTDPMQIIATGLDTIHPKDIITYLKKYLLTEQVEAFVLGDPKQMDGSPSDSAQHVKGFSRTLKKTFPDVPQYWIDERFTSKLAQQTIMQSGLKKQDRKNKERVDTISATIILQYFMEQHRL
jgi:putative Holliday junction resolvase